ncbi:MAG: GPW/gp25 family protein [Lachnospiraceae bacterium]|nr:GPW/gp25 family protein [Lachnospiraceae bacterium]
MWENEAKAFLGRGVSFPVRIDPQTGEMVLSSYEDDIKEAIRIILMTRKGEREANPDFGCGIYDYLFESMNYTTQSRMRQEVVDALVRWEPRIEDISVDISDIRQGGLVEIGIRYVVRATNNPFNLVFPYYLNEGFGE